MISSDTVFLVVDDAAVMRSVISAQLRAFGSERIVTAKDGAEALHILYTQRVDIVLCEWNVPVMSGLELFEAMRIDMKLTSIPFILITGELARDQVNVAAARGIVDLLIKPFTAAGLATRVEKALKSPPRPRFPIDPATLPVGVKGAERATVLVVDDTPENLELLSLLLKGEYRVRTVNSGVKALEICQSDTPPDLVLLDIVMPNMDGFEVARRMREHPTSLSIPVIFVTAMSGEAALHRGRELGAVDFITKPISPDELQLRVRNFMRYVELHKQLQADYDKLLEVVHLRGVVEHLSQQDMKSPMASVLGLVRSLSCEDSINTVCREKILMAEEAALHVINMVNRSSELFKIETGRFKLDAQPVEIGEILRHTTEIVQMTLAEKRLKIAIDVPAGGEIPRSLGDAMFCYSIFQNLILIACEAAPVNGRVAITLNDESSLRITIQYTGVVSDELREVFFDKFITHGKQGGAGIETYSVRKLVEAQNGRVALAVSDQENRTTITVVLPRYEPAWPALSAK